MIQDMAQEMFIKIFDLAVNSEVDLKQERSVVKQLKESARPVAVSHNQREALTCLLNLFKTYALDVIFPNEIDEIHANGSATAEDRVNVTDTAMFEIGTGGLGSVSTVIRPVIHKVCVHVLQKVYHQLVEMIIDHGLHDFYMLPVYILQYFFEYKAKKMRDSVVPPESVEFCIIPPEVDKNSPENRAKLASIFNIAKQAQNYEQMLFQIFGMKDITEEERLSAMKAFIAIHCIQDQAAGARSDRVIP